MSVDLEDSIVATEMQSCLWRPCQESFGGQAWRDLQQNAGTTCSGFSGLVSTDPFGLSALLLESADSDLRKEDDSALACPSSMNSVFPTDC